MENSNALPYTATSILIYSYIQPRHNRQQLPKIHHRSILQSPIYLPSHSKPLPRCILRHHKTHRHHQTSMLPLRYISLRQFIHYLHLYNLLTHLRYSMLRRIFKRKTSRSIPMSRPRSLQHYTRHIPIKKSSPLPSTYCYPILICIDPKRKCSMTFNRQLCKIKRRRTRKANRRLTKSKLHYP